MLFCFGIGLQAQSVDCQFVESDNTDCDNDLYCVKIQVGSDDGADFLANFSIRFNYNPLAILFDGKISTTTNSITTGTYTPLNFTETHPYDVVFGGNVVGSVAFYDEEGLDGLLPGDVLLTYVLNAFQGEQPAPDITTGWTDVAEFCFEVVDASLDTGLIFKGVENGPSGSQTGDTNFNDETNDPVNKYDNGSFGGLSVTFTEACTEVDCAGIPGGTATEDACGVCDDDATNDNVTCADCAGVPNGSSTTDACGVCDDDATNDNSTCADCAGVPNGSSTTDACGVCDDDATNDNSTCADCAGVPNGPSTTDACGVCDDDATNDNSTCADCAGVPNGPSTTDACGVCDDDATNDNATCADCAGVPNGAATTDACGVCDDNAANDNSTCADCAGVPNGPNTVDNCGTCDDDATNDCTTDCAGVPGGSSSLDACGVCDDDATNDNATCADCAGVPNGSSTTDACGVCDDDATNDNVTCADCAGIPNGPNTVDNCGVCDDDATNDCTSDCAGVPGGSSTLDACGVCDDDATNDNTTCLDCAGAVNGTATTDDCGVCDDDATNDNTTCLDCAGIVNGTATTDDCGVCDSDVSNDNTTCLDCAGVPNGESYVDACGTCDADPTNDCPSDCLGVPGGTATIDACGVCDDDSSNDNATCLDCAGVPNGSSTTDACGVCDDDSSNDNSTCADCAGVPNGPNTVDNCGVCDADAANDNDTCADCAGIPNGPNTVDNCGTCDDDSSNDCTADCAGVDGGSSTLDDCGVCDDDASNDNTTCLDCAGVVNGTSTTDLCGVCDADDTNDNETCTDCAGIVNGSNTVDDCGVCDDDPTNDNENCGQDPEITNDAAVVSTGASVTIDVLVNDSDPSGGLLSLCLGTGDATASNGTVVTNADGTMTYTPNAGFEGTDGFSYTACSDNGGSASGNVSIVVSLAAVCDVDVSLVSQVCDEASGVLTVTYQVTGTSSTYSIAGSNVAAGSNFTATYASGSVATVTVDSDDTGTCDPTSFNFDIDQCDIPVVCDLSVVAVEDCDESSGTNEVLFTFSGGTPPYNVSGAVDGVFDESGATILVEYADAAVATITIEDSEGCLDAFNFDFANCVKTQECATTVTAETTCDESTEMITVVYTVEGGLAPYVITGGGVDGTYNEGDVITATYANNTDVTIDVVDVNDCDDSVDFSFTGCEMVGPVCDDLNIAAAEDCDSASGLLDVVFTFTGGLAPYTVTGEVEGLFDEGDTFLATYSGAADININIVDQQGCDKDFTFSYADCVKATGCPLVMAEADQQCDQATGISVVVITFGAGTAPYTVSGDVTGSFDELATATVDVVNGQDLTISVEDAVGCEFELNYTVEDCFIACAVEVTADVSCNSATGVTTVVITATGGVGPYQISIPSLGIDESSADGTYTFTMEDETDLTVTATDSEDCANSATVQVAACDEVVTCQLSMDISNEDCNENSGLTSVTFDIDGASLPITVSGSGEITLTDGSMFEQTFAGGESLTYTVSDADGCIDTFSFDIQGCDQVCNLSVDVDPSCNSNTADIDIDGGEGPFTVSGDFTETISSGDDFSVSFTPGQVANFTITDAFNCSESFTYSFPDCTVECNDLSLDVETSCSSLTAMIDIDGGNGPFTVSGDFNLTIDSGDDFEIPFVAGGSANITVTDSDGCFNDFNLMFPSCNSDCVLSIDYVVDCDDNSALFDIDGDNGPFVITGDVNQTLDLPLDDFVVNFTDGESLTFTISVPGVCSEEFTVEFPVCTEPCDLSIDVIANCDGDEGGTADIDIDGGVGPFVITGDYDLVIDSGDDFTVDFNENTTVNFIVADAEGCIESFSIDFENCEDFECDDIDIDIDSECDFVNQINIVTFNLIGGDAPYTFTGGLDATINDDDLTVEFPGGGPVEFTVTDVNGCTEDFNYDFTQCDPECDEILLEVRPDCDESTGILTIEFDFDNGVSPYTLSGDFNFTIPNNGDDWTQVYEGGEEYNFTVVDGLGCEQSFSGILPNCEVNECADFDVDISEDCNNNTGNIDVTFTIEGGDAPYEVSGDVDASVDGDTFTATFGSEDNVQITVSDSEGCEESFSFNLDNCNQSDCDAEAGSIDEDDLSNGGVYCHNETISVEADGYNESGDFAQAYLLLDGSTIVAFTLDGSFQTILEPGTYCLHPFNVDGGTEWSVGDDIADILDQDENCWDIDLDCVEITIQSAPLLGLNYNYENCEDDESIEILISFSGGSGDEYEITETSANINSVVGSYDGNELVTVDIDPNSQFFIILEDDNGCRSSVFGTTGTCTFTAIELLDFSGRVIENGNELNWSTATEVNSDFFGLEWSEDGVNFTEIAKVEAQGNSNSTQNYKFLHDTAPAGVSYYRLMEYDLAGTVTASHIVSLNRDREVFVIAQVIPVPAIDFVEISFLGEITERMDVAVYSITGQLLIQTEVTPNTESKTFTLAVDQLSAGNYFLSVGSGNKRANARFIKN